MKNYTVTITFNTYSEDNLIKTQKPKIIKILKTFFWNTKNMNYEWKETNEKRQK